MAKVKMRSRAGSPDTFERRYCPIEAPDGGMIWHWQDVPAGTDERKIWTLLDCDGVLYVTPGIHSVNYVGRLITEKPWCDVEYMNPGYRW